MKIIIFDDDPTGSQTVYGCPLLLNWDEQTLEKAFKQPSPLILYLRTQDLCRLFWLLRKPEKYAYLLRSFF